MLREKPFCQEDSHPSILALQDIGVLPRDLDNCRSFRRGTYGYLTYPGDGLEKIYPWTREVLLCPWCGAFVKNSTIIDHPHQGHVGNCEITLQEVSEWVEEMEWDVSSDDHHESPDDHEHYARAVYFRDIFEWEQVLDQARKHGLTINSYLAAATRFVMRYSELSLAEFAYPDPQGLEFIPQIPSRSRLGEQPANDAEGQQKKEEPEKPSEEAA